MLHGTIWWSHFPAMFCPEKTPLNDYVGFLVRCQKAFQYSKGL